VLPSNFLTPGLFPVIKGKRQELFLLSKKVFNQFIDFFGFFMLEPMGGLLKFHLKTGIRLFEYVLDPGTRAL
jgi:hypothetical protein